MSEQNQQTEAAASTTEISHDRLAILKAKADRIGVQYHPSIGEAALADKIKQHEETLERQLAERQKQAASNTQNQESQVVIRHETSEDRANARQAARAVKMNQQRKTQLALVRCRITNLNPAKRDLPGEIFTVGNGIIGSVSKYVPYNEAAQSYHLPRMLVNMLRDKKYMQLRRRPGKYGIEMVERRLVPEFSIEELTPLTPAELVELATVQAAGHNIG